MLIKGGRGCSSRCDALGMSTFLSSSRVDAAQQRIAAAKVAEGRFLEERIAKQELQGNFSKA